MTNSTRDKHTVRAFDHSDVELPEQIPLLEDVVFDTQNKFPTAPLDHSPVKHYPADDHHGEPRTTDLFPQIIVLNGAFETAKQQADIDQIADQLVSAHPVSVIRKLRDELNLLLDDLKDSASPANHDDDPRA